MMRLPKQHMRRPQMRFWLEWHVWEFIEDHDMPYPLRHPKCEFPVYLNPLAVLDWIVLGRETGPGARPAKAEWFLKVIEDCKQSGVPVWVKKAPPDVPD